MTIVYLPSQNAHKHRNFLFLTAKSSNDTMPFRLKPNNCVWTINILSAVTLFINIEYK